MGLNCACPAAESLSAFEIPECGENFGQINKIIFQRVFGEAGVKNVLTTPTTLASWTACFTASGDSKFMVITPYVSNPTVTAGAARTYGGGNATPGGATKIIGAEPTTVTAQFDDMIQGSVISVMKKIMCENVGVYLINERGQIAGIGTQAALSPIPISPNSLFIGDKAFGGLDNPDTNAIQWSFLPNWSDNLTVITPEFDALSVLVNTEF